MQNIIELRVAPPPSFMQLLTGSSGSSTSSGGGEGWWEDAAEQGACTRLYAVVEAGYEVRTLRSIALTFR